MNLRPGRIHPPRCVHTARLVPQSLVLPSISARIRDFARDRAKIDASSRRRPNCLIDKTRTAPNWIIRFVTNSTSSKLGQVGARPGRLVPQRRLIDWTLTNETPVSNCLRCVAFGEVGGKQKKEKFAGFDTHRDTHGHTGAADPSGLPKITRNRE